MKSKNKTSKGKMQNKFVGCDCDKLDKFPNGTYVPIKLTKNSMLRKMLENSKGFAWHIKLGDGHFICERQEDAQILSMLARICGKLKIKLD